MLLKVLTMHSQGEGLNLLLAGGLDLSLRGLLFPYVGRGVDLRLGGRGRTASTSNSTTTTGSMTTPCHCDFCKYDSRFGWFEFGVFQAWSCPNSSATSASDSDRNNSPGSAKGLWHNSSHRMSSSKQSL